MKNIIKENVIFASSQNQLNILEINYPSIFNWIKYLSATASLDIFVSKKQVNDLIKNVSEYEKYSLNVYNHSGIRLYISKGNYSDSTWDGGSIASFWVKKSWILKDKFFNLLEDSCSLWTQYHNGSFDWVYDLSNEEVEEEYNEWKVNEQHTCNCSNCYSNISINEMREKINDREIELYDSEDDKYGLEYIKDNLLEGISNV